jgi:oxalate decarboxylase
MTAGDSSLSTNASVVGPRDANRERQNTTLSAPPSTDSGSMPNLRFSFEDAHRRIENGGWSREVTSRELPAATSIAGVNMHLEAGAAREMHWHRQAEWAFMLAGRARITAVDEIGRSFVADVGANGLWYFPAGVPHSIQGLGPHGCEFLLAFPDGSFSEESTFLLTDLFAHTPKDILAKNFDRAASAFAGVPEHERFIFRASAPRSLEQDNVAVQSAAGTARLSFNLMDVEPIASESGWVRIVDSGNFPASTEIAAAFVELAPGALREIHWHPHADEWQYYISGSGRLGVFSAEGRARTFDVRAGDVGSVPMSASHFIENTGTEPMRFLELFRAPHYADVSLHQWLALTPPELVQAHLNLSPAVDGALRKAKHPVVGTSEYGR